MGDSSAQENDDFCYVRRSGEVNERFNKRVIGDNCLYQKSTAWFYENECRLLVSVPQCKLSHPYSELVLRIDLNESSIDSLRKKNRIYNSPNVKDLSDDFYKTNSDSRLSRELNWNLRERFCKTCKTNQQDRALRK